MKKLTIVLLLLWFSIFVYPQSYSIEWQGCLGGTENDEAQDIIEIENGYLVAGYTVSNDGDVNSGNHGGADAWIVKLDLLGNPIWEKCYGGSHSDSFNRIFRDDEGNYILTGSSSSSDGDISYDPYPESDDCWIVKIDSLGNILWDRITGGSSGDQLWYGMLCNDGGVIAYGRSASSDGDISVHYGGWDIWMVKLTSEGKKEWDFTIGTDFIDDGYSIIETSDGGYLCSGSSWVSEGTVGNLSCDSYHDLAEAVLVKLDKDRNIEWQRCYGGSHHDGVGGLLELDDGYLVLAYTHSSDGDLIGSGYHNGESDIWILRIDFSGNIIWQKCYGGTKTEYAQKIIQNTNGDFNIFGVTNSQDCDISENHSFWGRTDIWMFTISGDGELLSERCFGGSNYERMIYGVVQKSDYNYVIAGQTENGQPSFDVQCTTHGAIANTDIWVLETKDTLTSIQPSPTNALANLKVYPNPAKEYVCFDYTGPNEVNASMLKIFNTMGAEIRSPVIYNSGTKMVWDTRQVLPGVYFYTFRSDNENYSGKVIIE